MRNQESTRLAAYDPLVIHVVLQSVQDFSQAVCRLQLHDTPIPFAVNWPS